MNIMKKILFTLSFVLFHLGTFAQLGYWINSTFIELIPDESCNYRYVQAMNADSKEILNNLYINMIKEESPSIRRILDDRYFVDKDYALPEVNYYESPIYKGDILMVLPRIILSLKKDYLIDGILKQLGSKVTVEHSVDEPNGGKRYYLTCQMRASNEVLEAIKLISGLVEGDGIRYFEPEMYMKMEHCNTYYSQQYYLHNTESNGVDINVEPAWGITTGNSSITVAVVDCGVEKNHEDLNGRVLNGYTIGFPTSYGEPVNDVYSTKYHGTSVAGIIAANNNSIGIRGIASNVNILPVNIIPGDYDTFGTNLEIANAIRWAYPYADVLNFSFGNGVSSDDINDALDEALSYGRNGKGCVIVAAAGNHGNSINVAYPARYNGIIAVGAVHKNGLIWDYSQTGTSMCLVAPSGGGDVVTTDRMAPKGKNPSSNYNFSFGGTSAAAPQVAGVAALMLSVNPNLTASQVKAALESTATDLGITGFDTIYGYGLVNAYAAVYSVAAHEIIGSGFINTSCSYEIDNLPNGTTVHWSLSDSYYNSNCLSQNTPTTNECTITRSSSHNMTNATLTAEIMYNGNTIQTLTKTGLFAYEYWGQYTSGNLSGNIDYTHILSVKPNWTTYISSPLLVGATVSYDSSGATPSIWTFSPTYGDITMVTTNTNIPVVINIDDASGEHFKLYAFPNNTPSKSIFFAGNDIVVRLNVDGYSHKDMAINQPWTIEVRHLTTGELKAILSSTSLIETISTSGWPKGVYIVKVSIGKEELTEKVIVK